MKKIMIAVSIMAAVLMTSCGGKQDVNGWYSDFAAAKKTAQAKNKNILLFVNSDFDDDGNEAGVKAVLSKEFSNALKGKYVLVHFDFTNMQSVLSDPNAEITSKEQKALEARRTMMKKQFKIADIYTVQATPSITLLTKDGYFASALNCEYTNESAAGYISLVNDDAKYVDIVNEMVAKTKKGSNTDKVNAIVQLHDSMMETHRIAMADLVRKAVQMDKKNASESMDKMINTLAGIEAYEKLVEGSKEEAAKVYAHYAEDSRLDKENAQMLYYTAANIINGTGTDNIPQIKLYLEKAVAIDPESEISVQINKILEQIAQMVTPPEENK